MDNIGTLIGPFLAAIVQVFKTIGMPKEWAFGLIIILGITAAVIIQFNAGAWPMILQAVQSIATAIGAYETVKRITQ